MKIDIRNLAKSYGPTQAVSDFTLSLARGEMVALLGPSGCGKTTTLRMVAGFIQPTSGEILVDGRELTRLPPHKRDSGLVFQSYALFPHMTVTENIAFGLRRRGVAKDERAARIAAIADKLKLGGLEGRYPRQLSGGQQQRVAVARALVINPSILLLDEPFSNLDARLRHSTARELRRIQTELGLTSIFVTHDQNEAMAIADRIAVMNNGQIEQIGTAVEIYQSPATRFVADFIGSANFLAASKRARGSNGHRLVHASGLAVEVPEMPTDMGEEVDVLVRPEDLIIVGPEDGTGARIEAISFHGASALLELALSDGTRLLGEVSGSRAALMHEGDACGVKVDPARVRVFPRGA